MKITTCKHTFFAALFWIFFNIFFLIRCEFDYFYNSDDIVQVDCSRNITINGSASIGQQTDVIYVVLWGFIRLGRVQRCGSATHFISFQICFWLVEWRWESTLKM